MNVSITLSPKAQRNASPGPARLGPVSHVCMHTMSLQPMVCDTVYLAALLTAILTPGKPQSQ